MTGADAANFEVDSTGLYIKAGITLDFETKNSYAVTVTVDDTSLGATPDASVGYTLSLIDVVNETAQPGTIAITEVAPWSSGNSPVAADWFEVTNFGASAIDITGWKMDDNSFSFGSAVALNGITSIAPGESVIFLETANLAATKASFLSTWFGANPPATLQIGSYTGSGVGLSTGGDGVALFNGAGVEKARVSFGASGTGTFKSFNNAAGANALTLTATSEVRTNGAFVAAGDVHEIGSPGTVGRLFISEVAPWSSGNSPVAADWFEVTNGTAFAIDITGWKMDDNSGSPAAAVALNGITSIAPGESVIFLETANLAATKATFLSTWFGANPPANLQIGSYAGTGVGLGTGGDAVNLYDATNTLRASVSFGTSPTGTFKTFENNTALDGAAISALSTAGVSGAALAKNDATEIGSPGAIAGQPYTLQILHFYGESGTLGAKTAPILGAMIDKFRSTAPQNTLTLAEGDTWIPGPWLVAGADPSLNSVAGIGTTALARPDIAIMNALGVNASALGNHEFDLGSPVVQGAIQASGTWVGAQFPFITSNLNFAADSSLKGLADASLGGTTGNAFAGLEAAAIKGKIAPYTVVTLNGEKIGIVGSTTFDLLTKTSPNGTVVKTDTDPNTSALQETAAFLQLSVNALRAQGVNKIVMVDQLDDIARDKALAPLVSGIDVIVAGGGHERLGDASDTAVAFNGHDATFAESYPFITAGSDGAPTLIVTTDTEYTYLGRLNVTFNGDGVIDTSLLNSTINGAYASNEATLQSVYGSTQTAAQIVASSATGSAVQAIASAIDTVVTVKDGTKFGYSNVYLEGDRVFGRAQETNLGDLTADANAFKALQALGLGLDKAVVSLKNGGGLRASVGSIDENGGKIANPLTLGKNGNISQLDVENSLRFDNKMMVFDTTPQGLLNILNYAASLSAGNGGWAQVGGVRFSFDPSLPSTARVRSVALYDLNDKFVATVAQNGAVVGGAPALIQVVCLNFTTNGGDGYPIKANASNFRFLLADGTLSAPLDPSLDFTATANVPANALGEQKALQDYLTTKYSTPGTAYSVADTPAAQDLRIENLSLRADAVAPCFAEGTRLATIDGPVAVEALAVGQRVPNAGGGERVVKWIGHRQVACWRHPRPHDVWPVRVAPHAFGAGMPATTLWLSPDHAVFIDGVLIPVRYLINDATITQVPRDVITYWHVELDAHDVILAEGLACESYLDTGNRGAFANGGGAAQMHPDFARAVWATGACAALATDGAELEAARSYLLERAGLLGHALTQDAAFRVLAAGRTLPVARHAGRHRFVLPGAGIVRLASRSAVPAYVCDVGEDHRRLGVAVARIWLDGVPVALDDALLGRGGVGR